MVARKYAKVCVAVTYATAMSFWLAAYVHSSFLLDTTSQSLVVSRNARPTGARHRHLPQVGASIAVHPPKFHALSRFLEQWFQCPAALAAMSLHIVFSNEADLKMFRDIHSRIQHRVPDEAWHAVVGNVPLDLVREAKQIMQNLAAWKKWYGIAHLMDLGVDAPKYGLMLDAEILPYNISDCGTHSAWTMLFDRLQAAEASRKIPAARVSDTMRYQCPEKKEVSGKQYDQVLIADNLRFAMPGQPLNACSSAPCQKLRRMHDLCLFSWWSDIPFLNLTVAGDLIANVSAERPKAGRDWRAISRPVRFTRFEMISYHVWCVLHEGYDFWDVTEITKETSWGSFLEDPQPGSRLSELEPMWISADALVMIRQGKIGPLSRKNPPLLVFHVDHREDYFPDDAGAKQKWQEVADVVMAETRLTEKQDLAKRMMESGLRIGYFCDACRCGSAMPTCGPLGTFAYHDGSHCCNEKTDHHGKPIALQSDNCMGNAFFLCPGSESCATCSVINVTMNALPRDFNEQAPSEGKGSRGKVICDAASNVCNCLHPEFPDLDKDSEIAKSVWKIR